jgi:hypothetical protein
MSGMISFLRNYEFLNITKSVTEAQLALYKKPTQTWGQFGSKLYNICWYNCESIAAVGIDVAIYSVVSSLRSCNLLCPLPPTPPTFPIPHDNVEFIRYTIERALWDWNLSDKKEMKEGIADGLSDRWNIYQVVGEWSLAHYLENAARSSFFKPTFLTISEPLENGETFLSVCKAFARLWQSEQKSILDALFRQGARPPLSSAGKKVYQEIRAIASKLQQGNQIYLIALNDYMKQLASDAPAAASELPKVHRPTTPSAPLSTHDFPRLYPALTAPIIPAHQPEPSAPPLPESIPAQEMQMAVNVQFLRVALQSSTSSLGVQHKQRQLLKNSWRFAP